VLFYNEAEVEIQDSQSEKGNRNKALGPMTEKILVQHAIMGFFIGACAYVPITCILFYTLDIFGIIDLESSWVWDAYGGSVIVCFIPSLFVSVLGGVIGGAMAYKKGHKYLGAVIGGLAGQIIISIMMVILIIMR
jgi:hypothetical protein